MKTPENLLYTKDHEWILIEGDIGTVGITDHAQHELGDVVFLELPKAGDSFELGQPFGSVESVKAVSEIFCPVSGELTEVNKTLSEQPETVNSDPYGDGWMIRLKIRDSRERDQLLTADEYSAWVYQEKS
ncbi:MAG TPA: glycine cleavage system protein GcvH [Acidobacteriota bacterium]|jgi:glycine cleavage system H protein